MPLSWIFSIANNPNLQHIIIFKHSSIQNIRCHSNAKNTIFWEIYILLQSQASYLRYLSFTLHTNKRQQQIKKQAKTLGSVCFDIKHFS